MHARLTLGIFLGFILSIVGVAIFLLKSGPVLWSYKEPAAVHPLPTIVIFNPIRNRKPETEAEELLTSLRNGKCEALASGLGYDDEVHSSFCENLADRRLEKWRITFRRDTRDQIELFYDTKGFSDATFTKHIRISLDRIGDEWKVADFGLIY